MKLAALMVVIGCSGPAQQVTPQPGSQPASQTSQTAPAPTVAATQPAVAPAAAPSALPVKNQPPHIKLRLGHYRNDELGIGVVIDLTEMTENVADIDPAKIRFDGDTKVWKLQGQNGPRGRIDYLEGKSVMLHVWDDGRRSVYVPDPNTGRSSDEITLRRDGDADPL